MWVESRIFEVFSGTKKSGDGLTGMSKDEIRMGRISSKMTSDEFSSNFFPHPLRLPSWKWVLTVLGWEAQEPSGKHLRSHNVGASVF